MKQKEVNIFLCHRNGDYRRFTLAREEDLRVAYYIRFHTNREDKFAFIDHGCCTLAGAYLLEYTGIENLSFLLIETPEGLANESSKLNNNV